MSTAAKCDKCGALYVRTRGCVCLDVAVVTGRKVDTFQNWSDVDLCHKCSKPVLDALEGALDGLRRPR